MESSLKEESGESILGLSTDDLAGLSVDELEGNPTAIKMLLHYYAKMIDENRSLKNQANTLRTYVDAYTEKKSNSATGAILLALSNILIGFGVSLLISDEPGPGWSSLVGGVSLVVAGIYFSFYKGKN